MALTSTQIQNAYVAFFNRPADVAGLNYWSSYSGNAADLLNTFAQSSEYKALYANMNNTQVVNAVYQNLFNKAADVAGLNYWVSQLDAGKVTIGNVADAISKGAQGTDAAIITNKVAAAEAFTKALDTTAEIVAYAGVNASGINSVKAWLNTVTSDAASVTTATGTAMNTVISGVQSTSSSGGTGQTFTLTTGTDYADAAGSTRFNGTIADTFKFSGANDVVNATAATIGNTDVLADSSALDADALNVTLGAAGAVLGSSVTGIENLLLTTSASNAGGNITWGTLSGLKTVTVSGAGTGVLDLTNTSTANGVALANSVDASGLTSTAGITFNASGRTGASATQDITVKTGGTGVSTITTASGADNVTGAAGVDNVVTGAGNDTVNAGGGNDVVSGGVGDDVLNGEAGDDQLNGNSGNDTIDGGAGNDVILGNAGLDKLTGGEGADTFRFTEAADGNLKTITDFSVAQGDVLSFGRAALGLTGNTGGAADFAAGAGVVVKAAGVDGTQNQIIVDTAANIAALNNSANVVQGIAIETDTGRVLFDADSNFTSGVVVIGTIAPAQAALIAAANLTIVA